MWYFKGINRTILSEHIIRRIEAGKKIWYNKLVEDTANNNFDHVGTLKYINLLLHIDIHPQRVKYIINEQSMNINVFLLFLSFVFLQIERERERERVYKIGYKEKQSQGYLSYLDGFLWRIFPLLRANRLYAIFNTDLKKMASRVRDILRLLLPRVLGFGSVPYEPCPTTNFLIICFRWREGVPTSVLGSQPIVWLLPSSFPCQAIR